MRAAVEISEGRFTAQVLEAMQLFGWRAMHPRPARTAEGWRTAVSGPGCEGWPDIFAVRDDRALAVELKSRTGRYRPGQREWLEALAAAGVETATWRPSDWPEIERVLRR